MTFSGKASDVIPGGRNIPEATMLRKVMTWKLVGIFLGVVTIFITLSGYIFNWIL